MKLRLAEEGTMRRIAILFAAGVFVAISQTAIAETADQPPLPDKTVSTDADTSNNPLVPPGARDVFQTQDNTALTLGFVTDSTPKDLAEFFRAQLTKDGWKFDVDLRIGLAHSYNLKRTPNGTGLLLIQPERTSTRVILQLNK
jgi:hypothetical protein